MVSRSQLDDQVGESSVSGDAASVVLSEGLASLAASLNAGNGTTSASLH